ncbi:MAG: hypothetical protein D6706_06615 [Chloroflexi bacterium]|nr:MAG: hypothetical protein D6706_06615 [Chloroflexota bacterium]
MRIKRLGMKIRVLWVLLVLLGMGTAVSRVFAHAVPVISDPLPNAILDLPPEQIIIRFNEPVVPELSRITLLAQTGDVIPASPVQVIDTEGRTLAIDLPEISDGTYLVSWQVLSTVDGHTTSGTFSFGVGVEELAATSGDATVSARLSPLSAAARSLAVVATTVLAGGYAFRLLVWVPGYRRIKMSRHEQDVDWRLVQVTSKLIIGGLVVLAGNLILVLVDQNNQYSLFAGNFGIWAKTQFGRIWLGRVGLLLLGGVVWQVVFARKRPSVKRHADAYPIRGWGWWAGLLTSMLLAVSISFVSHSAALSENVAVAITVDFVHTLAASLWVGGLIYLAISLWLARELDSAERSWLTLNLLLDFSGMAATAVGFLLASGGYLAWQHVNSWTKLVGTAYGLVLLGKIMLALPAFGIAAINLLVIKPRLYATYEQPETEQTQKLIHRFTWLARGEALFAVLVLLSVGILTDLQRAVEAPLLADAPGKTTVTTRADDLDVTLTIEPALTGPNTFEVRLTDENGQPVTDVRELSFRFTFLDQSIGASEAVAEPVGNGIYQLEGSYISLIGNWQVEIAIRRPDKFDAFAPFRLEAGLGGSIRSNEQRNNPLESIARFMTLAGGGGTGILLILFAIGWGILSMRAARNEWQLAPLLLISLLVFWLGALQAIDFFTNDFTPTKFLTNPILPDAESVAIGKALYEENCVVCHGPEGHGDGPAALTLNPPPADFAAGHTATHPDGDLYYWIREGIPDSAMPAFGDKFTKEETWHLVNYVRRLSAQTSP